MNLAGTEFGRGKGLRVFLRAFFMLPGKYSTVLKELRSLLKALGVKASFCYGELHFQYRGCQLFVVDVGDGYFRVRSWVDVRVDWLLPASSGIELFSRCRELGVFSLVLHNRFSTRWHID